MTSNKGKMGFNIKCRIWYVITYIQYHKLHKYIVFVYYQICTISLMQAGKYATQWEILTSFLRKNNKIKTTKKCTIFQ